jgi:hypothetical protein
MPSITYWNRLEPRTRSTDLTSALAARVRDPAWLLARQWQLGELAGEDAGSPAYVRIRATVSPITAWTAGSGEATRPLAAPVPLERAMTSEPFSPNDLALAVELSRVFDRFLADRNAQRLRHHFLDHYEIAAADPDDDPAAARLRMLWRGRAYDGLALLAAADPVPPAITSSSDRSTVSDTHALLVDWVRATFGAVGVDDPPGWQPEHLAYATRALVPATAQTGTVLAATPDRDGDLEWFAFDDLAEAPPADTPPAPSSMPLEIRRAVIPGPVKFRGMPNERFWDFEDGRVDLGALQPDRRDLAALVLIDFMLVHGNDWFLVPFEQPVGTLCRSELEVIDVFGDSTAVPRADAVPQLGHARTARWTMFSTTRQDTIADFFLLPNTASASVLDGPVLEEVRFLRDETANLVWAVEYATEGRLGRAVLGRERESIAPVLPPPTFDAALDYRIQTHVPRHWFPFQPVALAPDSGEIALERAALLADDASHILPAPDGKLLTPRAVIAPAPYRIREEEVPREGRRVARRARLSRDASGGSHLWVSRQCGVGTGEGWAGLQFDLALPRG